MIERQNNVVLKLLEADCFPVTRLIYMLAFVIYLSYL